MAWILETFAGVALPILNAESDLGTPTAAATYKPVIGGLWDTIGAGISNPTSSQQFQVRGIYAGVSSGLYQRGYLATQTGGALILTQVPNGSPILVFDPITEAESEYDALAAKLGVRGTLTARNPISGATRTKLARLLRVERVQRPALRTALVEVAALFESADKLWT